MRSEAVCSSTRIKNRIAVVTGASSGIGRAVSLSLAREGIRVHALGRNAKALQETVATARECAPAVGFQVDLMVEESLEALVSNLNDNIGQIDILVHSAGVIYQDPLEHARIADFDCQYATNVRAPYLLTQRLLPFLIKAKGQIVFMNSSVGLEAKRPEIGQYAATKHALKAIADSLREELNPKGVRVLTVYLGRTATPMQEAVHLRERRAYYPEALLQPEDVASVVVHTLLLPRTAEVTDISVRPMIKVTS